MIAAVLSWIDDRTGLVTGIRGFFDEDIPASSGWHQVFGSVALFLLMMILRVAVLSLEERTQALAERRTGELS